jgi:hypothetical protein
MKEFANPSNLHPWDRALDARHSHPAHSVGSTASRMTSVTSSSVPVNSLNW